MGRLETLAAAARAAAILGRRRLAGPRPRRPAVVSFLVTSRCPLRCRHCFNHVRTGPGAAPDLDLAEVDALGASLGPIALGLLCGGEPFAREDLSELAGLLRRRCSMPLAGIATNGQLGSSVLRQVEAICRGAPASALVLSISIDGFRETHDALRGKGTFDRAVSCLAACRELARNLPGLFVGTATVVSAANQGEAASFLRWAKGALEPDFATVLLVRQEPRDGPALKAVDPARYLEAARAAAACSSLAPGSTQARLLAAAARAVRSGVHGTMLGGPRPFRCHAGLHGAVVEHDGRLGACEVLSEVEGGGAIGDLREAGMDFGALWESERARAVRRLVGRHPACRRCTHETMGYLPSLLFSPNRPLLLAAATSPGRAAA